MKIEIDVYRHEENMVVHFYCAEKGRRMATILKPYESKEKAFCGEVTDDVIKYLTHSK